jgi:predicted nicotinamide N-methyase
VTRLRSFDPVVEEVVVGDRRLALLRPGDPDRHPYWARVWPSSLALAGELLERDLRGVRVLELGCGLGLGAIAASLAGAVAIASDVDRDALVFARENGKRLLGRRLETIVVDVREIDEAVLGLAPFELVLVSDVLYNPELVVAVTAGLERLVAPGGEALVVHPWKAQADGLVAGLGWSVRRWEAGGVHLVSLTR